MVMAWLATMRAGLRAITTMQPWSDSQIWPKSPSHRKPQQQAPQHEVQQQQRQPPVAGGRPSSPHHPTDRPHPPILPPPPPKQLRDHGPAPPAPAWLPGAGGAAPALQHQGSNSHTQSAEGCRDTVVGANSKLQQPAPPTTSTFPAAEGCRIDGGTSPAHTTPAAVAAAASERAREMPLSPAAPAFQPAAREATQATKAPADTAAAMTPPAPPTVQPVAGAGGGTEKKGKLNPGLAKYQENQRAAKAALAAAARTQSPRSPPPTGAARGAPPVAHPPPPSTITTLSTGHHQCNVEHNDNATAGGGHLREGLRSQSSRR